MLPSQPVGLRPMSMHDALVLQEHHHHQMQAVQLLQMPLLDLYTAPQMLLQAVSRLGVHA